jgi:hypothetical protein
MSILILKVIIALIFLTEALQDEREYQCAKYFCDFDPPGQNCAKVDPRSPSNRIGLSSNCRNGEICKIQGNPWQTLTYANESKVFNCLKETPFDKRLPGESCNSDSDCAGRKKEGSCENYKCIGAALGETCQKHNECVVGLFCNKSSKCAEQKGFGAECNNSYECINSLLCQGGTCSVTPYSLQYGDKVDGDFLEEKCALGIVYNGKCSALIQTDDVYLKFDELRRCELGEKCAYSIGKQGPIITKDCQCGYNEDGFGYCPRGHDTSNLILNFRN